MSRSSATSPVRLLTLLTLATTALSHMMIQFPAPIRSKFDKSAASIDYDYTAPLHKDGSNFPCKGYLGSDEPAVTSFNAGQTYTMTFSGSATHNGGTCQITMSVDGGQTFKVIKTMIGACPPAGGKGTYDFTVPSFVPTNRKAVFAWSWINHSGNREFYMDCSFVDVKGGAAASPQRWAALPNIFVAQLSGINSCAVREGMDVVPARPGSDVVYGGGMSPASARFTQNCEWSANGAASASSMISADNMGAMPQPQPVIKPSPANSGSLAKADGYNNKYSPGPASTLTPVYRPAAVAAAALHAPECAATVTVTVAPGQDGSSSCSSPSSASAPSSVAKSNNNAPPAGAGLAFANEADTSMYMPCQPGTFLCTSASTFLTCDQSTSGWAWLHARPVAAGMACMPSLVAAAGSGVDAVNRMTQMPGVPAGQVRSDRYVGAGAANQAAPASPDAGFIGNNKAVSSPSASSGVAAGAACSSSGALGCSNGGQGFMMCANGAWTDMGSVAAGTKCVDGGIVAA